MKIFIAVFIMVTTTNLAFCQALKISDNVSVNNQVNLNTDSFTPENSGLVSAKVNKIFIDSFNVKWFGTDKGISRWDGEKWSVIDTSNYLHNNTINDMVYEKTSQGDELWVATNGGLSVMSYNIDGVTSATTYYVGSSESGIISDTVTAVGLDKNHVRWIATPRGINTFGKNGWDTIYSYWLDGESKWLPLNGLIINSIGSYEKNNSVYMGTSGQGVLRYSHNDVDGFTGASSMNTNWSGLWTDTVYSVSIYDTIQWYGTPQGAFEHFGPSTKEYWDFELTNWEGIINPVVKDIEKDDAGNIWIGTEKGLNIITDNGILKYGPAIQTSNIEVYATNSMATISWTDGNGFDGIMLDNKVNDIQKDFSGNIWIASKSGVEFYNYLPGVLAHRVVFVTEANSGTIAPVDGLTYIANSEFNKGTSIGNWFCVYNGTENTVDIGGLSPNTTYRVMAFEFYGEPGKEKYSLIEGTNNPINFTTLLTGTENLSTTRINVYPVPFNDFIVVHYKGLDKNYHATIYNLDGKIFKSEQLWDNNQKINTSDLVKGVYLMKISDGKSEEILKIIK
jgi:ligand-binding sensor domain-containing protein